MYAILGEGMEMENMIVIIYHVRRKLLGFLPAFLRARLILINIFCWMVEMEEVTSLIL
jgi:hypothetical protein